MDDKLTFEDFFAVIGIIAVAAVLYALYKKKKAQEAQAAMMGAGIGEICVGENISMNPNLYAPTNTLDGYMQLYDYSEASTIGVVPVTITNPQQ